MGNLIDFLRHHPKKCLIFDFDETLVRLVMRWSEFKEEIRDFIFKTDPSIDLNCGLSSLGYVNELIKRNGNEIVTEVKKLIGEIESRIFIEFEINKDLINFVELNADVYEFCIWSSNDSQTVMKVLLQLKMEKYFKVLATQDMVKMMKPYKEGFELIKKEFGFEQNEYLMIGNNLIDDKEAAENSGIDFFYINSDQVNWGSK